MIAIADIRPTRIDAIIPLAVVFFQNSIMKIAGRLAEKHGKPAIILQDLGDHLVASARSNEHFNIVEALTEHSDLLDHFGGHAQAAGFNIQKEKLEEFTEKMQEFANKKLKDVDLRPSFLLDCEINKDEINWDTIKLLEDLEPFGVGNQKPIFLLREIKANSVRRIGRDQKHLSFSVNANNENVKVIGFQMGEHEEYLRKHEKIDLACYVQKNEWNGQVNIQLQALDFK